MNTKKMIFKLILITCYLFLGVASRAFASQTAPVKTLLYGGSEAANYFVSDAATATAGLGSISGAVTNGANPVSGIAVYVKDINYTYISGATTDTTGHYTVSDLPTGSYKVEFDGSGSGYVIQWYNNKPDFNTANPVSVTEPATTTGINAVLVRAATTLGGIPAEGTLKITINNDGSIAVYRYISGTWQQQIYIGNNKGSRLQINGVGYSLGYYAGTSAALVSNSKVSDTRITSVWTAGGTRITLNTTYQPGASYFGMQWTIANESSGSLNDLRFFHGEDTYFYNSDYGAGFWDTPNHTVGVQKTISGQLMRMSLQAITIPYAYDSMYYFSVYNNVGAGALTNTIDPLQSTDNGYALEWRKAALQNGDTWTISAYEKFADVAIGSVSVTAPTQTDCYIGSICNLVVTVTNISQASATVSLSVTSSQTGWAAQILTPASPVVLPIGSSQQVNIQVSIPASAMDGVIGNVTLSASDGTSAASDVAAVRAVSNTYTITTRAGAGGTVLCSPAAVAYGGSSTCTITSNTGYTIQDVLVDGASVGAVSTYTFSNVTASHTISATFSITTHTVTPSAGAGGTINPSTPQTVSHNATISFTVTPSAGYTASVGGTCSGILVGNRYTTLPITFDCTVVASFTVIAPTTYTVSAVAGTGGSISPSSATVITGHTTFFTVTPNTGYGIASVTGCNGTLTGNTYTTGAITANCTVSASFSANPVNGACGSANGGIFATVPTGNLCSTGTASAVSGSGPWNWICNGSYGGTNANCSASLQSFTVTPSAGAGGSISPSTPQTVSYNATTAFTVTPNTGYGIASVTGCGGNLSGNAYTTGPITANCTVSAAFKDTFTITTPTGPVEIKAGGTFRISTTGASNVIVDGVSIGAVNIVTFINITGPHTITW